MELLKKEGGYALFKLDGELHFVNYKSSGLYTSIFVFGLIALITLLNVVIQLFMGKALVVSALLIPGLICLFLWRKQKMKRRNLEGTSTEENTILIIDTIKGQVFTGDREPLGKLETCRFAYDFQLTSSACKLMFYHEEGKIIIAKGNPFEGSRKPFKEQLKKYKLAKL